MSRKLGAVQSPKLAGAALRLQGFVCFFFVYASSTLSFFYKFFALSIKKFFTQNWDELKYLQKKNKLFRKK